ncbi:MAG TPA: YihY/virulence factor BrkB family protein [Solirubrobacteraceae bacterium]|nr:YihY/virulence factor BrkB family protein [Solirubrobacteraceae bacterium]
MKRRTRGIVNRIALTTWRSILESVDDRIHRDGAQVAFFAVLSFVPLALLLVAAFGLAFEDADVRTRVVKTVFENIPLSAEHDRERLEATVSDALRRAGSIGPFSVLLLIVAGSGVMGALRHTINEAWDIHDRPPLLRRKALDLALILGATIVLALSLAVTATRRAADVLDDEEGAGILATLLNLVGDVLPFVFTGAVILFLYCVLPMQRQRPKDVWPGVVVAVLLLALLREGLELYFEHLADFGALYGSLGALMALLLFVYAAAMVLLFGAEFASEWTRLPSQDEVAHEVRGLRRKARGLVRQG